MLARQRVRESEAIVGFALKSENQSVFDKLVLKSIYKNLISLAVLSISTDGRRKASATSLREVGYFSP